jgi:beta-glucosidase
MQDSSLQRTGRFRQWQRAAIMLAGAAALGACSSTPKIDGIASLFGSASKPASAAAAPTPAQLVGIDFATSTEIHPEIWPLGTSGVPRDPAIEARVARLLSQMTLEEKVGQLFQPDIAAASPDDVRRYHVGSVLNSGDSGPNGVLKAPAPDWLKSADAYYQASVDVPAGHPAIPVIWGIDAMHGNDHIIGATIFPHNIGLGAMRDPDLVRKIGEITAQEMRVTGQDWTFAPVIAVVRDDRWGRTYESFSEDTAVVSENAAAMVEGLQGVPGSPDFLKNGRVLATAKHYLGDGATDKGRDQGDTLYGEPALRDLLAPPYEAAIKAGVQSVMASYSSWRGAKMHGNKGLLDDVLVGRLGFNGFVVSDFRGFAQLPSCTVADCPDSLNAGVDMYMTANEWKTLYGNIVKEVGVGRIPMARLDDAVARILRVKLRMGLLDAGKPSARPYAGRYDLLGSPEHRAVARQAVRESLVLLKNDGGILPLSPRMHVLVAGDGADNVPKQTGGWTISWQGNGTTRADFPHADTIFEGIKANVEAAGGTATLSVDGSFGEKPDVVIVVFGENPYVEFRGDRPNVDFESGDRRDLRLLERLRAQGIPVVSVFLSGRPLYVTPEINASEAFVAAWLPGSEGEGVSDVLFAKPDGSVAHDFRGKLSFSWPRSPTQTQLNIGTEPYYPLFSYGYGLTYGTPRNLGMLPEATTADLAAGSFNLLVESGRAAPGLSLVLTDMTGERIGADPAPATVPTAALRVERGDRNTQNDMLVATWSGVGKASLAATANQPSSFEGQAADGMALTMDLRVDAAPTRPVTLAVGSATKLGNVDLTQALKAARGKGWTKIAVPLSCFRRAGADMGAVTTPMMLTTSGRLTVGLSSAVVAPGAVQTSCPAPEASIAHVKAKPHVKKRRRHAR